MFIKNFYLNAINFIIFLRNIWRMEKLIVHLPNDIRRLRDIAPDLENNLLGQLQNIH
jgi:hypothetical protein